MIVPFLVSRWPWVLAGTALVVLAIGAGLWAVRSAGYRAGDADGRAAVQALWDAERRLQQQQLDDARRAAADREARDRRIAQEHQDALQARADTADRNARDLARRLRDYQARPCPAGDPVPGPADAATGADPAPGGAGGDAAARGRIDAAVADVMAACARDAERLAGWQRWWTDVSRDQPAARR